MNLMSKSRKIIIAAAVAFAVLMMAFIFFFLSYMLNPVLSVKVTELSDQYEKVSQIGDRYFILQNSEITDADSGSTVFGSESPVKFFRNYNDSLWAFTEDETDNLICLDADGNPVD